MHAWVSLPLAELRAITPERIAERLTLAQTRRFSGTELAQLNSWYVQAELLQRALSGFSWAGRLLLEYDLLRLEKRIDAVLLTDRAIFVLEFKIGDAQYGVVHVVEHARYGVLQAGHCG